MAWRGYGSQHFSTGLEEALEKLVEAADREGEALRSFKFWKDKGFPVN